LKTKIWVGLSVIAIAGGLYFLGLAATYVFSYFSEPENSYRHEYLQGVALSMMMAIPFWLVVSGTLWPIRAVIPRAVYVTANGITACLCMLFLVANIYPIVMVLLGK